MGQTRRLLRGGRVLLRPDLQRRDSPRPCLSRGSSAGLPTHLTPHSFRVMVATALLSQKVPVEGVQYLIAHYHLSSSQFYDGPRRRITRKLVERIPF